MENPWVQGGLFFLLALLSGGVLTIGFSGTSHSEFVAARICLALAAIETLALVGYWLMLVSWPVSAKLVMAGLSGLIVFPLVIGSFIWLVGKETKALAASAPSPKPDVTMRFFYRANPALVLENNSDVTATQIKWTMALWNLDDPLVSLSSDDDPPDAHHPLPIQIQTFDFINAHSSGGPQNILGSVAQYVKRGQLIFGTASVICPNCDRGHTYILSILYGEGGWFSEITNITNGGVLTPKHGTKSLVATFARELAATVLDKNRIPIVDP